MVPPSDGSEARKGQTTDYGSAGFGHAYVVSSSRPWLSDPHQCHSACFLRSSEQKASGPLGTPRLRLRPIDLPPRKPGRADLDGHILRIEAEENEIDAVARRQSDRNSARDRGAVPVGAPGCGHG